MVKIEENAVAGEGYRGRIKVYFDEMRGVVEAAGPILPVKFNHKSNASCRNTQKGRRIVFTGNMVARRLPPD